MMLKILFRLFCTVAALLTLQSIPAQAGQPQIVASFSILADLASQVGGSRVSVVSLIGPDSDAHGYQSRPSDARKIKEADLVLANGLGFDSWIERLAASASDRQTLVLASRGITPLTQSGKPGNSHDHDIQQHESNDPHAWQDVANTRKYVANIAAALIRIDPDGAAEYRANAQRYDAVLRELDSDIRTAFAALPQAQRTFATSHDAFGYFAKAYGLRILAASGISSSSEPSAASIAQLIQQLRQEHVPAVFLENITDPRMIERIATESGARIGGKLYTDALTSTDGSAPTYEKMMRANLATLLMGLRTDSSTARTPSAK